MKCPEFYKLPLVLSLLMIFGSAGAIYCQSSTNRASVEARLKDSLARLSSEKKYVQAAEVNNRLSELYMDQGRYESAQKHLFAALRFYEKAGDSTRIADINNNIGNLFLRINQPDKAITYYRKALRQRLRSGEPDKISQSYNHLATCYKEKGDNESALEHYDLCFRYLDSMANRETYARVLLNKSNLLITMERLDEALQLLSQATHSFRKIGDEIGEAMSLNSRAYIYELKKNPVRALEYYRRSYTLYKKQKDREGMIQSAEGLMLTFASLGNTDSVYYYYEETNELEIENFAEKTSKNLLEIEAKYQTEKKEQQLALRNERIAKMGLANKSQKLTIWILVIVVGLALTITVAIWLYDRQKQRISALEIKQKNDEIERLIQDQETLAYESQLEGELKERRRVASDLHDRLGGLLATINLHFQQSDENPENDIKNDQIRRLLKSSIEEVRSISHNLHSEGTSKGLRNSLEQLQKGLVSSGKIHVDLHYELDDLRLPQLIVVELFKIIQELVTNTLKHAEANTITIQISRIEDTVQLIYEDDGKGFDATQIRNGIGLENIENRVKRCHGVLVLDSALGRGTTTILNIPIEP